MHDNSFRSAPAAVAQSYAQLADSQRGNKEVSSYAAEEKMDKRDCSMRRVPWAQVLKTCKY